MVDFLVAHAFEALWTVLLAALVAYLRKSAVSNALTAEAQADATANNAIQAAVANFAGTVRAPSLGVAEAVDTAVVARLEDYLERTVPDSLNRLKVGTETLATMLSGKLRF